MEFLSHKVYSRVTLIGLKKVEHIRVAIKAKENKCVFTGFNRTDSERRNFGAPAAEAHPSILTGLGTTKSARSADLYGLAFE